MHFVDLTTLSAVTSTFGTYTVRFVDPTSENAATSTLCTLAAVSSVASLPSRR